jgi:hypothetical protein
MTASTQRSSSRALLSSVACASKASTPDRSVRDSSCGWDAFVCV